jgi:uronate dehydrogenase
MKLLITGAAGKIGRVLRQGFRGRYDLLRLTDRLALDAAGPDEECVTADLGDRAALDRLCAGIDCVVHLAGVSEEPPRDAWQQVLPANIVGSFNLFEAARHAGVRRIVFASSNHAVGFYERDRTIGVEEPVRPDGVYGLSKCFGEALGRLYADKHGMSVACLRIGSFRERPEDRRQFATWLSHRDAVQLFQRCIEAPKYDFAIVYGISNNEGRFWSNDAVRWLGYEPQDSAEDHRDRLEKGLPPEDPEAARFHGGSYCLMDRDKTPGGAG